MTNENKTEEISLLDLVAVMVKRKRVIFGICGTIVTIAIIVSLLLPNMYMAKTTITSPKDGEGMAGMLSKAGDFGSLAGGILGIQGINKSVDLYVEMLGNRTIVDAIIKKFDLTNVYGTKLMEYTRDELVANTRIKASKANNIEIAVEDRDPQRAVDITNAYVEELDKLVRKLAVLDATRERKFIEERLDETRKLLSRAEYNLKDFQEQNKIVALSKQSEALVENASKIMEGIASTKIEIETAKCALTWKNNNITALEKRMEELNNQLSYIYNGKVIINPVKEGDKDDFYVPLNKIPELELRLGRLEREVRIHEAVFSLLTKRYEMARIAEAKNISGIQVLDKAVVPKIKSRPKRGIIVVLSAIISLFLSVFIVFIHEHFDKIPRK